MDDPTGTTISNKPALIDTKVGEYVNADSNDTSGDCNLHAGQLQVYNYDMNTKDEASDK